MPPVEPMLANAVPKIPTADGMRYEPKWDGFRTIVFRDGDEVELVSRGGKTMTRYFPEVVAQMRAQLPPRCVVDGEVVLVRRPSDQVPRLDFEALQQRIHPAASRVRMLAATMVRDLRGRRAGWADREARRDRLRTGQATHVQDQACPYGRLRRGRLPVPQDRGRGRLTAAGPVRRGGPAAPRRGQRVVHGR